mmetsp:Transcript_49829/g.160479  ORF Transcript_49829/g.160479 Transcript_49829/m.160479 type:complete len:211 (+) Transcript_49829:132-764(+)
MRTTSPRRLVFEARCRCCCSSGRVSSCRSRGHAPSVRASERTRPLACCTFCSPARSSSSLSGWPAAASPTVARPTLSGCRVARSSRFWLSCRVLESVRRRWRRRAAASRASADHCWPAARWSTSTGRSTPRTSSSASSRASQRRRRCPPSCCARVSASTSECSAPTRASSPPSRPSPALRRLARSPSPRGGPSRSCRAAGRSCSASCSPT